MNENMHDKFIRAIQFGRVDEVERLIPLCDPKHNHSEALWHAATIGNIECLRLLIPVCDPKSSNSLALRCALYYQHKDCVAVLYPLSNVNKALTYLSAEYDFIDWAERLNSIVAHHQQGVLNAVVGCAQTQRVKKI